MNRIFGYIGLLAVFACLLAVEFSFNRQYYLAKGAETLERECNAAIDSMKARDGLLQQYAMQQAVLARNNVSKQAQNERAMTDGKRDPGKVQQYDGSITSTAGQVMTLGDKIAAREIEIATETRARFAARRKSFDDNAMFGMAVTVIMPLLALLLALAREILFEIKGSKYAATVGSVFCQLTISFMTWEASFARFHSQLFSWLWVLATGFSFPVMYMAIAKASVALNRLRPKPRKRKAFKSNSIFGKAAQAESENGFHESEDEPENGNGTIAERQRKLVQRYYVWLYVRAGQPKGLGASYKRAAQMGHGTFYRQAAKIEKMQLTEAEVIKGLSPATLAQVRSFHEEITLKA